MRNIESNPIYNCIKKKKLLKININQEVKDLYTENCKTFMKKIEEIVFNS